MTLLEDTPLPDANAILDNSITAAHAAYGTGEQVSHYLGQKWGILQLPQTATPPTRTTKARTLIKVYATVLSSNGLYVPPDEQKPGGVILKGYALIWLPDVPK